jgi:hypothetical protein
MLTLWTNIGKAVARRRDGLNYEIASAAADVR